MEHRDYLDRVISLLEDQPLVLVTEVDEALASDLDRLEMIAHEVALLAFDLGLDGADAVVNVVETETRLDSLLLVLVRESVDEVVVADKESSTALLEPSRLLVCIRKVNHIEVRLIGHDDETPLVFHSHDTVQALADFDEGLFNFLLGFRRTRDPGVAARLH